MSFYARRSRPVEELPLFGRAAERSVVDSTVTPAEAGRASLAGTTPHGAEEGLSRKQEGQERVEARAPELAELLRAEARRISAERGWATIDDVREFAEGLRVAPPHKNFWGCIFRGPGWERAGEAPSERETNHGHLNPRWRWRGRD